MSESKRSWKKVRIVPWCLYNSLWRSIRDSSLRQNDSLIKSKDPVIPKTLEPPQGHLCKVNVETLVSESCLCLPNIIQEPAECKGFFRGLAGDLAKTT